MTQNLNIVHNRLKFSAKKRKGVNISHHCYDGKNFTCMERPIKKNL